MGTRSPYVQYGGRGTYVRKLSLAVAQKCIRLYYILACALVGGFFLVLPIVGLLPR